MAPTKKKSRAAKMAALRGPDGRIKKKTAAAPNAAPPPPLSPPSPPPAPADYGKLV